ncbi:heme-binding protein [Arthrobacter sp. H5]|uniref:GlcG/HbpS family heme-binding protein n=1 Tax=Arthrobacter sp. H5 TaxID=1267973 RepID=UPI0004AF5AAB|nr:heme-binding protein [Arthrobacter sp. H5]
MVKPNTPRLTFAVASAAVLAVGLVACSSSAPTAEPASDSTPVATAEPTQETTAAAESGSGAVLNLSRLSVQVATEAAQAALSQCQSDGLGFVSVAVVDRFGQIQAMLRGDNAAEHTMESARLKGYTAAAFGANTSELTERAAGDGATIRDLPGTLFLAGGVSVKAGELPIAGIGVGGAPQGTADEACAQAGLDAIAGSLGG